jgi:hypothetical protein
MPKGKDTGRHPNRQVSRDGNVFRVNFDPRQNHPSMQKRENPYTQNPENFMRDLDQWFHRTPMPDTTHSQDTDEAPAHGIPRPKTEQ